MENNPLTPSQIEKLLDLFRAALRIVKLFSSEAQDLIENHWEELKTEVLDGILAAINRVLERKRNTIIRTVTVNRHRAPQAMLDATARAQYTEKSVVKTIPRGEGEEPMPVEFFKLSKWSSPEEVARGCKEHGIEPDAYAVAAVNEADPVFADAHPNIAQWKDEDGNWCYIAFNRLGDERSVDVRHRGDDWDDRWWIGGVRKSRTLGK